MTTKVLSSRPRIKCGETNDWVADRMENPQDYDEQHVTVSLVDSLPIDTEQPNTTIPSAATYGSINN